MNAAEYPTRLAESLARAKREILADIAQGILPATVDTFDELHTYVEANRYGGLRDNGPTSAIVGQDTPADRNARATYIRDMIDSWLQTGRADSMPCEVCDTDLLTSQHTRRAFSEQRPEGALVCSITCRDEHYRLLAEDLT